MGYFVNFDFSGFWDDSEYAVEEYLLEPPPNVTINRLEAELGYKLPESYIWHMKKHNGGIPVNDRFPTSSPASCFSLLK